ncbi:MAG: hypothetical protein JEZ03_09550 [Bacteroidales bacterium]|nr:hypothetical protein [Bacteroidales bacterium]
MKIKLVLFVQLFLIQICFSQTNSLFESHELFQLRLRFDFRNYFNQDEDESIAHPALLSYHDSLGKEEKIRIHIRKRGNFRQDPNNCAISPFSLIFRKKHTQNTLFEDREKIKVVVPCNFIGEYKSAVIKELLCYKIYELFSSCSYKTRIVSINFTDKQTGKAEMFDLTGFLLEPKTEMISRICAEEVKEKNIPYSKFDSEALLRFFLFQFLIGNSDWMIQDNHNVKIIETKATHQFVPVAYDFDLALFCNAPYLSKVRSVDDRMVKYQGVPIKIDIVNSVVSDIFTMQEKIEILIQKSELADKEKSSIMAFVNNFYDQLNEQEFINSISK